MSWRDVPGSTFSVRRHSLTAFAEVAAIMLAVRSRSVWTDAERTDAEPECAAVLPTGALPASAAVAGIAAGP